MGGLISVLGSCDWCTCGRWVRLLGLVVVGGCLSLVGCLWLCVLVVWDLVCGAVRGLFSGWLYRLVLTLGSWWVYSCYFGGFRFGGLIVCCCAAGDFGQYVGAMVVFIARFLGLVFLVGLI